MRSLLRLSVVVFALLSVAAKPTSGQGNPHDHPWPVEQGSTMSRLWTAGAETKDVSSTNLEQRIEGTMNIVTTGAITADTATKRTGVAAFKFDTGVGVGTGQAYVYYTISGGATVRDYFLRAYVMLPTLSAPGAASKPHLLFIGTGVSSSYRVSYDYTNTRFYLSGIGNSDRGHTDAIEANRWYRLELRVNGAVSGADTAEFRMDGVSIATTSADDMFTGAPTQAAVGCAGALGGTDTGFVVYADDVAFNDDQGSAQNTWPGEGRVVLLLPTSDNSAGSWRAGSAGSASANGALFNGIDNTPPVGTASALAVTAGISNAISGATNPNGDFNMTAYSVAAPAATSVKLVQPIVVHGEDISTGTKTGTFNIVSNPNTATTNVAQGGSNQFGPAAGGAVGTYLTNWVIQLGPITYDPSVTLATAPVMRITKTDTGTRAADVCFMGILAEVAEDFPLAQLNVAFANHRAAGY